MFDNNFVAAQGSGLLAEINASMPVASWLLRAAQHAARISKSQEIKNTVNVKKPSSNASSSSSKENRPVSSYPRLKVVKPKKPTKVITVYSSPVKDARR